MLSREDSVPMTEEQMQLWMNLYFIKDASVLDELIYNDFACKVIQKRIDVLKLPIVFDKKALAALSVLCDFNVGRMVVSLIDILDAEIKNVTLQSITELYPWGHYSQQALDAIVAEHKARKHKHSGIY